MNSRVHYEFTKEWAGELGFDEEEAEAIAAACRDFDKIKGLKGWGHFPVMGSMLAGRIFYFSALRKGSLKNLGRAIHIYQDYFAHRWMLPFQHDPEKDRWESLSEKDKKDLKARSASLMSGFKKT